MPVVEVIFLAVFWSWMACAIVFLRNTILPRTPLVPAASWDLISETVRFRSTDGLALAGWKIPTSESWRPWIVLCHGVGANRADLLEVAGGLHQANFNLLLMDFRGHGGSAGRSSSFGWREQRDLEGALTFLGQQPEVPPRPYGLLGISMGGVVGLLVAARDERIGAVVAESPYDNLQEALRTHMKLAYPRLPMIPFFWFVLFTYRLRFGVWPRRVAPDRQVGTLSPRPLLLIHGADDRRMPLVGVQRLLAAAGQPKELWLVDGAGHLGVHQRDPGGYAARIVTFFAAHLQARRGGVAVAAATGGTA